jgi:hypothetical protein
MLLELQETLVLSNITSILVFLDKTLKIEKINKEEVIKVEAQYYFYIFLNNSTKLEFVSLLLAPVFEGCLIDHKFDTSTLK